MDPSDFEEADQDHFDEEAAAALDELEGHIRCPPAKKAKPSEPPATRTPLEQWLHDGCPDGDDTRLASLVAELTPALAFTTLLDIIFARGEALHLAYKYPHPPGCADVEKSEWMFQFSSTSSIGPMIDDDATYDVPEDVRFMHGSYSEARRAYANELYQQREAEMESDDQELQAVYELSRTRRRALNLMKRWLWQYGDAGAVPSLEDLAAARLALTHLHGAAAATEELTGETALAEVRSYVQAHACPPHFPEALACLAVDALLVLLVVRRLVLPDLIAEPDTPWGMRLPFLHDGPPAHSSYSRALEYEDGWWHQVGVSFIHDLMAGVPSRGALWRLAYANGVRGDALSVADDLTLHRTFVQAPTGLAALGAVCAYVGAVEHELRTEQTRGYLSIDGVLLENLCSRLDCHPLSLAVALPALTEKVIRSVDEEGTDAMVLESLLDSAAGSGWVLPPPQWDTPPSPEDDDGSTFRRLVAAIGEIALPLREQACQARRKGPNDYDAELTGRMLDRHPRASAYVGGGAGGRGIGR